MDGEEELSGDIDETNDSSRSRSCEGPLMIGRLADQVNRLQDGRERML
jgi:hypothetical protein